MFFASDYPFFDVFWTIVIFFVWVAWLMILFRILGDIFRRHDISGWGKAAWLVFVVVVPFLGVLIYLIANGNEMAKRDMDRSQAARAEFDDYVKSTAGSGGPAAEIDKAKQLLDSGAITQAEFDAIKAKALPARNADHDRAGEHVVQAAAPVVHEHGEEAREQRQRSEQQRAEAQQRPARAQHRAVVPVADADVHQPVARRLAGR